MTGDKTIELTRSDDQSITVSSGTDTFTIAFCEVPRVNDNAERRFQRVRKPLVDINETKEDSSGPFFPFTIYGPPTEGSTKGVKKSGSHFLVIKDDKAFAIRMVGNSKESAFKVKVRVGGVNVLQHTTHGEKSQDYFVISEQKWVWGKQVSKDTARQFRVFRRGRERLSLRYQLLNNNIKKEVEIEITSRRPRQRWRPIYMTLDGERSASDSGIMPQPAQSPPQPAYQATTCQYIASSAPYSASMWMPALQTTFQEPAFNDTGPSTPYGYGMLLPPPPPLLTTSHEIAYDDLVPPTIFEQAIPPPVIPTYQPQASQTAPTELVTPLSSGDRPSSPPSPPQQISQATSLVDADHIDHIYYDYMAPTPPLLSEFLSRPSPPQASYPSSPEPVLGSLSSPPSPPSPPSLPAPQAPYQAPTHGYNDFTGSAAPYFRSLRSSYPSPPEPVLCSVSPSPPPEQEGAPKTPSDQESIHSDPEEDMLPHQMVVGTGGLIEQIVHTDKHPGPEWIDECTVTLKFKIVDPDYLKKEAGVKKVGILGGNYREVPNPPNGTFRGHAPVVTDPDGLRRDIRSPMEMEMELNRNAGGKDRDREPPESPKRESPVDSGVGLVGEVEGDGEDGGEQGDQENMREFKRLRGEAKSQPRGLMNDIRMKKKRHQQRKRGGVRIMAVKRKEHEPKGERKSRWRTFVDAMRRVLTLGR